MAGPNPTFAECWTQLGKILYIVDSLQNYGSANTPNYLDREDGLITVLDGEFTPSAVPLLRAAIRNGLAAGLSRQNLVAMLRPFALEMLRAIGSYELAAQANVSDLVAWRAIRQYMEDNAQLIKSRNMTFDTSATGSVTGTGVISRLSVDKDANNLECTGAESKTFVCDKDQNSGATKHAEEFEFRFDDADASGLQWIGTGGTRRVTSLHAKSSNLLVNPSFEQGALTDATALTSTGQITGWDVTTAANLKTYSAAGSVYRGYANDTGVTHYGLQFIASDTLIQVVKTENPGARFDPETPYHFQLAWQRQASATGTLTIHLGTQTVAVAIGSGTNNAWNVLELDLDSSRYYDNFKENALDVKIDVATLATGTVVVDDLILAPMVNLDGTWWAPTGGATPWLKGDTRLFSGDAQGTATILNYWLWRAIGDLVVGLRGWFPSTTSASAIVLAEPS